MMEDLTKKLSRANPNHFCFELVIFKQDNLAKYSSVSRAAKRNCSEPPMVSEVSSVYCVSLYFLLLIIILFISLFCLFKIENISAQRIKWQLDHLVDNHVKY